MNWLKDNVYIATWLGPIIAIVTAFRGRKSEGAPVDWFRFVLWFSFFLCLAVTFTPQFDETARAYAKNFTYLLLGPILIYKKGF